MLGALGATAAVIALAAVFFTLRAQVEGSVGALLGIAPVFLSAGGARRRSSRAARPSAPSAAAWPCAAAVLA
jgi:hypothetical protein